MDSRSLWILHSSLVTWVFNIFSCFFYWFIIFEYVKMGYEGFHCYSSALLSPQWYGCASQRNLNWFVIEVKNILELFFQNNQKFWLTTRQNSSLWLQRILSPIFFSNFAVDPDPFVDIMSNKVLFYPFNRDSKTECL
jgi:hypothetical protein